jgi:hypothetical protein
MKIMQLKIGAESTASARELVINNPRAKEAGDIIKQVLSLPHGKSACYRGLLKPLSVQDASSCKKIYPDKECVRSNLDLIAKNSNQTGGGVTREYLYVLFPNYFRRIY